MPKHDSRRFFLLVHSFVITFARAIRFASCAVFVLTLFGCSSRVTLQSLRSLNSGADVVEVCVRPPTVEPEAEFWAYSLGTQKTVSDGDAEALERFVKTADIIYRYDPNAPSDVPQRLPWPYEDMTCNSLSSSKTPDLPTGIRPIPISVATREALVAALMQKDSAPLRQENTTSRRPGDPRFMGENIVIGGTVRPDQLKRRIDDVGQILRDAVRAILPKTSPDNAGPSNGQISIIDTKTGQIIGGMGAGAAIGTVPGGVMIANEMHSSGQLPQPTREFVVGEALGEMGSGVVQMGGGGVMTVGGAGASATGGGALVGAPVCVMGVALAANGAVTFFNGARTLIVAVCHWNELPSVEQAQPLAAAAPKDAVSGAPAPQSGGASPPTTAAAAKPAQTTPAKPAPGPAKPAKPAPKPSTPSGEQTPLMKPRHYGSGTKSGNTITWVRCTGQKHHAISKRIHEALQDHKTLKNVYKYRDSRFVTQAVDKAAHNGYEKWHKNYEKQVQDWLDLNKEATPAQFEAYLFDLYKTDKVLAPKFPNGL